MINSLIPLHYAVSFFFLYDALLTFCAFLFDIKLKSIKL